MSTAIAKNFQIGADSTPSNNFTLYQPASPDGTLRLGNGNTGITSSLLTLTSAGNLGVGTSSPAYKLDVNGVIATGSGSNRGFFYNDGSKILLESSSTYPLAFSVNGAVRATLDSSGNLGLGVTPSAWNSGYRIMQFSDATGAFVGGSGYALQAGSNAYINSSSQWIYGGSAFRPARYEQFDSSHRWYTAPSGTAGNAISFTQAMTLTADGRLGIGTTSPGVRLDLGSTGNTSFFTATNGIDANFSLVFSSNTATLQNTGGSGVIAFNTNSTERARIDSSGNLLVGKTAADNSSPGVWLYNNSAQAGRVNIAKNTSGLFNAIANYFSNTYVGGVNYDNTSTSFPTSSDIRLKKDIVDAGSASAKIDQIRIVAHGWKHDDATVEFGVIAQELINVAPQAVSVGDDGEEAQTTWGVDYSKLVPMLIKAHQEQQAIINQLKAEFDAYKATHP